MQQKTVKDLWAGNKINQTGFISALFYENPVGAQDATTLCCPLRLRASTYSTSMQGTETCAGGLGLYI